VTGPVVEFDEASHTYKLDGKPVPSVSEVIRPAYDFRFVKQEALDRAADLGKKVHRAIQLADINRLNEDKLDPVLANYLHQWRRAKEMMRIRIIKNELVLHSKKLQYCGTTDTIVEFLDQDGNVEGDGILDIKTGSKFAAHKLQTMGYTIAGREMGLLSNSSKRASIYLDEDGFDWSWHINDNADHAGFIGLRHYGYWEQHYGK
jgi:hypothetical protein